MGPPGGGPSAAEGSGDLRHVAPHGARRLGGPGPRSGQQEPATRPGLHQVGVAAPARDQGVARVDGTGAHPEPVGGHRGDQAEGQAPAPGPPHLLAVQAEQALRLHVAYGDVPTEGLLGQDGGLGGGVQAGEVQGRVRLEDAVGPGRVHGVGQGPAGSDPLHDLGRRGVGDGPDGLDPVRRGDTPERRQHGDAAADGGLGEVGDAGGVECAAERGAVDGQRALVGRHDGDTGPGAGAVEGQRGLGGLEVRRGEVHQGVHGTGLDEVRDRGAVAVPVIAPARQAAAGLLLPERAAEVDAVRRVPRGGRVAHGDDPKARLGTVDQRPGQRPADAAEAPQSGAQRAAPINRHHLPAAARRRPRRRRR